MSENKKEKLEEIENEDQDIQTVDEADMEKVKGGARGFVHALYWGMKELGKFLKNK